MTLPSPSPLRLTPAALAKLADLIANEPGHAHLRVAIEGGGCSGLRYVFALETGAEEGDRCGQDGSVRWVVDPISAAYLEGAELDYAEDLAGARFVVRNPGVAATCGCGQSFQPS